MNLVTKNLLEEYHLTHLLFSLKETGDEGLAPEEAKESFKEKFLKGLKKDPAFEGVSLEDSLIVKYIEAKIEENEKCLRLLPKTVGEKLNRRDTLKFELCKKEDKEILTPLANRILDRIDGVIERAKINSERVRKKKNIKVKLDYFIGEIVTEIVEKDGDFILCFEENELIARDYKIIKKDDFIITKWNENDPFSPYAILRFACIEEEKKGILLRLLFTLGDEFERLTHHEIVLECKNLVQK